MLARNIALAGFVTLLALNAYAEEAANRDAAPAETVLGPIVQDEDAIDRMEGADGAAPVAAAALPLYDDEGYLMPPVDPRVIAER